MKKLIFRRKKPEVILKETQMEKNVQPKKDIAALREEVEWLELSVRKIQAKQIIKKFNEENKSLSQKPK